MSVTIHSPWPMRIGPWLKSLATRDVFPEFSARVRRLVYHPLGVMIPAGLISLFCGFFLHSTGFTLAGSILAVIVAGTVWPWLNLRGLSGQVSFDRGRAVEGDKVEVCLTLRNRLFWAARGLAVRGGLSSYLPAIDDVPAAGIASAPRRRTVQCRWMFVPGCRGIYPLSPLHIGTGFPFGLWENRRKLSVDSPLIVWPRVLPVGPVPPVSGDRQVEGNVSRSKVGGSGDVLGVRPYRRGDSPRRIHWGQSAKHDRLIVCELESNVRPVIQLILDADSEVHAGNGPDSSREWAIRIVASLATGWLDDGARVGLTWSEKDIAPASGRPQLHKILDALAALTDPVDRPLADVLASPKCRSFRDGLQVIVTTDHAREQSECETCLSENQRWVVLRTEAFTGSPCQAIPPKPHGLTIQPWLWIDAIDRIPTLLRKGWREARHGS